MKEKIMFWWKCDDFMEKFKEPIFEVFCKTKGENGFPLHFPDDLLKESDFLITAHNKKDKIIGYMLISMSFENSIFSEKRKTFLTENDVLYDNKANQSHNLMGYYIEQVCILPEYQNKQFGVKMYNLLKEKVAMDYPFCKNHNIYAHVATDNRQSMKFHCKQGFIPIGDFYCDDFYGYQDYHSILFELPL